MFVFVSVARFLIVVVWRWGREGRRHERSPLRATTIARKRKRFSVEPLQAFLFRLCQTVGRAEASTHAYLGTVS